MTSPLSASPVLSSDIVPTLDSISSVSTSVVTSGAPSPRPADARQEFWSEWAHVRSRLRVWSSRDPFTTSSGSSTPSSSSTPSVTGTSAPELSESSLVSHASEVFRHASLLFAERLAFPTMPARSPQIQTLVSSALHHLASIPPTDAPLNKTLLWALCVIGTECVRPQNRDIIRLRCGDCMREQGVFCGASGMDVLERIWAIEDAGCELTGGEDDVAGLPLLSSLGGQASRWNKAMSMALPLTNINMNIPMEAMPMPSMPMSAASVSASWGMHDLAAFV